MPVAVDRPLSMFADNDPLNKTDPTGLRPGDSDLVYEDPCIHLAKDPEGDRVYTDVGLYVQDGSCGYLGIDGPELPKGVANPAEVDWCKRNLGFNALICSDVMWMSRVANTRANEYWEARNYVQLGGRTGGSDSGGPPDGSAGNAFKHIEPPWVCWRLQTL